MAQRRTPWVTSDLSGLVELGRMFQLAGGTVIVKSERATYAGRPGDMD